MSRTREFAELATAYDSGGGFGFRNRIINGDCRIDQRNNGAAVTVNSVEPFYASDRFRLSGVVSSGVFTGQRVVDSPAGFINSLKITVTTADTSLSGSALYYAVQNIEGFNTADFGWGTASAQSVTISFWVKSSLTGTFGGALSNSSVTRSYPFSYVISAANTWEYKTVVVAGDTTGTWETNNDTGIRLYYGLGVASGFAGTAGAWAASQLLSATGAVSVVGTNGATFYITGVQLEAGSVATPFERRPFGTELALCQRYAFNLVAEAGSFRVFGPAYANSTTTVNTSVNFPVSMRSTPTSTLSAASTFLVQLGQSNFTPSAVSSGAATLNTSLIGATVSGATIGSGGVLLNNSSASASILFSAEL
jgi:hypothetical protein